MNKNEKLIPIVFTPDEFYLVPTSIAIASMLETKKIETEYFFYIIVSEQIGKKTEEFFFEFSKKINAFHYKVLPFDSSICDKQKTYVPHLTSAAYYRLFIADLISEDYCQYHDGDILVLDDLKQMNEYDYSNYYIGGILAVAGMQQTKENEEKWQEWGIDKKDSHVHSGDLFFNLKKIREDNLTERFLKCMERGLKREDVAVLNICCYGKIKFLPLKFCLLNRWVSNDAILKFPTKIYSEQEIEEARNKTAVLHFAGTLTKPWVNLRTVGAKLWWKYAKKYLEPTVYKEWYERAVSLTEQRDWSTFSSKIPKNAEITIFGFGEAGKNLCKTLQKHNFNVIAIADNNNKNWGETFDTIKVDNIENIIKQKPNCFIINAVQSARKSILNQLSDIGIPNERIIDFCYKINNYYLSLDESFFETELRDVCLREFNTEYNDLNFEELVSKLGDKQYAGIHKQYYFDSWIFGKM